MYTERKPSSLCLGQRVGNWFCYCSGQPNDQRSHEYCGNCTSTFVPGEINGKPIKKNSDQGINALNFDVKDTENTDNSVINNIMTKMLVEAEQGPLKWEWKARPSQGNCQTDQKDQAVLSFAVQRPSVVCEAGNTASGARVCLCVRNRQDKAFKEVCGSCESRLRVQTIDGKFLET
jgi:hypothetical protein